uniref:V-set and immunoglobulin domain-containing protein 1-like n=1 Tax=Poecilia latipinna TaxID=48699 RepID=A0A3B3UV63_9TELE
MDLPLCAGCAICLLLGNLMFVTGLAPSSSGLGFEAVNVGQDVTLKCSYKEKSAIGAYWYKESLGWKPQLMSEFLEHATNGSMKSPFKNDPRFELDTGVGKNNLKISNVQTSDSAIYYCVTSHSFQFHFLEGITVQVKDLALNFQTSIYQSELETIHPGDSATLNCTVHTGIRDGEHRVYWLKNSDESNPRIIYAQGNGKTQCEMKPNRPTHTCGVTVVVKDSAVGGEALVHQAASESARPGDSVTLNCTVQTGSCQGEHRVYWFRKSSKYDPGLVYAHGDTADQCLTSPDTQTHTCLYKLPMENIKKSHVGTYYCAVASCGRIDFGNGTKLELESEAVSLVLVYFLCAALIFTIILNVLLAVKLYKKHNKDSCQTSGNCWVCSQVIHISTFKKKSFVFHNNLHYAAVNVNQPTRSRRQKKSQETECVYSSMKQ